MEALEAILPRRSIQKHAGELVTAEEEKLILKAAMNAQNTFGQHGCAFVVVRDPERPDALSSIQALSPCIKGAI